MVATVTISIPQPRLNAAFGDNGFQISFRSIIGVVYITEHTDDLGAGLWIELDRRSGSGEVETVPDPEAGAARRFYRVRALVSPG